ncbi:MAG TPA: hypothetical protein VFL83_18045 [Anaeromyxobacter sp.]|nr:hypothetical protein [Anaeromyxobacter sp.]
MSSSRTAALALLAAACSRADLSGLAPLPRAVEPASGYAGEGADVLILGERFYAEASVDVDSGARVDARFRAWLGGVELSDVRWLNAAALSARVPPGIPAGALALEVEGPRGTRGAAADAYRAFAGTRPRLSVDEVTAPPVASVGQELAVVASVLNSGGSLAAEVVPRTTPGGDGVLEPVGGDGPVAVPGGEARALTSTYRAAVRGAVVLAVGASGVDPNTGAALEAAPVSASVLVQARAALSATAALSRTQVSAGDPVEVAVAVTNSGEATARAVAPSLSPSAPSLVTPVSTPEPQDVPGGRTATFTFRYATVTGGSGAVSFAVSGGGEDANDGEDAAIPAASSAALTVQRPAALTATARTDRARYDVDQTITLAVEVRNVGEAAANAVVPAVTAPPFASPATSPSSPRVIAGGARETFVWTWIGSGKGSGPFSVAIAGADANDDAPLWAQAETAAITVEDRATLDAAIALPDPAPFGTFTVALVVRNVGEASATGVLPGPLTLVPAGTSAAVTIGPTPAAAVDIPGGGEARFEWGCVATTLGTVQVTAGASGRDANDDAPLSASATSGVVRVAEATQVASDPFGDGTAFSFVFGYRGHVYLGPSRSGTGAVRCDPDGSGCTSLAFSFHQDAGPTPSRNPYPPYVTLGSTECQDPALVPPRATCGPDDEDGRGIFDAFAIAGREWLVAMGARKKSDLHYAYMSDEEASPLRFSYVDLRSVLPPTSGVENVASMNVLGDRLYVGLHVDATSAPHVVVVKRTPSPPGLDAAGGDAAVLNLDGTALSGRGNAISQVESIAALNGRVYLVNGRGCLVSRDDRPPETAADLLPCTPQLPVGSWSTASIVPPGKTDLEPMHEAVPYLVPWGGKLYAARNVRYVDPRTGAQTTAPQLWRCTPQVLEASTTARCGPTSWTRIVPNAAPGADASLTQFDDPDSRAVTALFATAGHLYVGFNNARTGVQLFRTGAPDPVAMEDWSGASGCRAPCTPLGGAGFGDPANERFLDARAFPLGGVEYLYATIGTAGGPVRVFRVAER